MRFAQRVLAETIATGMETTAALSRQREGLLRSALSLLVLEVLLTWLPAFRGCLGRETR